MKTRQGFVSNSSTDSYLIVTTRSAEDMKRWLEAIYKAYSDDESASLEDALNISEVGVEGVEKFYEEMVDFYGKYRDFEHREFDYLKEKGNEKGNRILRIDGTSDNSIPYSIMIIIEDAGLSHHAHWG